MHEVGFPFYIGNGSTVYSCIDAGIRDALAAYSRYIHGKVVERSVWESLISYATDRANRYCGYSRGGVI
ncbi:MAG: hypothetical protein DRP95_00085 [Candidatus Latescibacterota bacterium]|nr:MAG: hypothetical protein DRP95_00085 [Candidatus Latescibacterota bacterium]